MRRMRRIRKIRRIRSIEVLWNNLFLYYFTFIKYQIQEFSFLLSFHFIFFLLDHHSSSFVDLFECLRDNLLNILFELF